MLTPMQTRLAMALLDLTRGDIACAVGVHRATISNFLHDNRPISSRTLGAMEKFFKERGLVFLEEGQPSLGGGEGVRLRHGVSASQGTPASAMGASQAG